MPLSRHAAVLLIGLLAPSAALPATKPAPAAPVQEALIALVSPRGAELSSIDINRIVARTGERNRDIQVITTHGPVYFGWPSNVTPVEFVIDVGDGGDVNVRAAGYSEENKARYAAALDAVLVEAVRQVRANNVWVSRPRS